MRDDMINTEYAIIGEFEGEFKPNQNQIDALDRFKKIAIKIGRRVKLAIAIFVTIDYIGYAVIAIVLPIWLIVTKFKGE